MVPVGEILRRTRLKRNLQLEEVSNELKISTRLLQAIENDQYDKLPGGVFAKSFVRQYARLLGLDEEEIAERVQQFLGPVEEVPQFAERPKPGGVAPIQVPKVDEWETVGDKRFHWSAWLSAAVLVAVMVVCSAVYAWIQRPKAPVTAQASPPTQTAPQAQPAQPVQSAPPAAPQPVPALTAPPTPEVPPPADSTQASEPKPPEPQEPKPSEPAPADSKPAAPPAPDQPPAPAPDAAPPPSPNPEAAVHIQIVAEESVWVSARTDGKYAFSVTMSPHTTRNIEGVKEVILRLGNAGGVTISLNGKPIGPTGPKGQVRTLQFTSGGFQIVPASPAPAAPAAPDARL